MEENIKPQFASFQVLTNTIGFYELEVKGGDKEYYVEGYISTSDLDLLNDVVTSECMEDMVLQIKGGNIKLDIEHETVLKENFDIIPAGRILDARLDSRGLWVKALLNRSNERFTEIWGSVKDGMLDAFSIAFKPLRAVTKYIQGKAVRLLQALQLISVGLTGTPVNPQAKMTDVFVKALGQLDSCSSNKIDESKIMAQTKAEEKEENSESEDEASRKKRQGQSSESEAEDVKPGEKSKKSKDDEEDEDKEKKSKEDDDKDKTEVKALSLELKSMQKQISALQVSVKSLTDENKKLRTELESPEMKALGPTQGHQLNLPKEKVTPLQLINK